MLFKHLKQFIAPDILDIPVKLFLQFLLLTSLSKEEFAIVGLGMLFFSYHPLGQFGTLDYLMLKLPESFVKSDLSKNYQNLNTSNFLVTFNTVFAGFVTIVLFLFTNQNKLLILSFLAFIIQSLLYQKYLYRTIVLRYSYNLKYLSKVKISFSFSRLIFSSFGLYFYGIYGYLLAEAFIYLIPLIIFRKFRIAKSTVLKSEIISLIKLSFPFLIVSFINLISSQIDRWVVISNSSLEIFADYTLCMFIVTSSLIMPGKINSMIIQYFREYYVSVSSLKVFYKHTLSYLYVSLVFLSAYSIVISEILTYIIYSFIPKYETVLPFINILILLIFLKHIFNILVDLIGIEFKQNYISLFKTLFLLFFVLFTISFSVNVDSVLKILVYTTVIISISMLLYIYRGYFLDLKWGLLLFILMFFGIILINTFVSNNFIKIICLAVIYFSSHFFLIGFYKFFNNKSYMK